MSFSKEDLHQLYISIHARATDNTGFNYWLDVQQNNPDLELFKFASFFIQSREARSNFEFVKNLQGIRKNSEDVDKFISDSVLNGELRKFAEDVAKNISNQQEFSEEQQGLLNEIISEIVENRPRNKSDLYDALGQLIEKINNQFKNEYTEKVTQISDLVVQELDSLGINTPAKFDKDGRYVGADVFKDFIKVFQEQDPEDLKFNIDNILDTLKKNIEENINKEIETQSLVFVQGEIEESENPIISALKPPKEDKENTTQDETKDESSQENVESSQTVVKKTKVYLDKSYEFTIDQDSIFKAPNPFKSKEVAVFEPGIEKIDGKTKSVESYRIPALLQTDKGTLIAATDIRYQHKMDWGNIDTGVKRSTDGGKTWSDIITVLDMPTRDGQLAEDSSAFFIDPALVQLDSGRIVLVVDMFPESRGLPSPNDISKKFYQEIDGKKYQILYSQYPQGGKRAEFYVKHDEKDNNGFAPLYNNSTKEKTNYKVKIESQNAPYKDMGDIYENGNFIGNIYIRNNYNGKKSPIISPRGNYVWMSHSDDDGLTWSSPVDITANLKEDWMNFFGTGPGSGIVTKVNNPGRIVFTAYTAAYANNNGFLGASQSSRLMYSDDDGETWFSSAAVNDGRDGWIQSRTLNNNNLINTESSVVELNNGDLAIFMRNTTGVLPYSISKDGGKSWGPVQHLRGIKENYVQLSALHYNDDDGKEYILIVSSNGNNPNNFNDRDRTNGTIKVLEVTDGDQISYLPKYTKPLRSGEFAYNQVVQTGDDEFGVLYETVTVGNKQFTQGFTKFNFDYLKGGDQIDGSSKKQNIKYSLDNSESVNLDIDFSGLKKVLLRDNQSDLSIVRGSGSADANVDLKLPSLAAGSKQVFEKIKIDLDKKEVGKDIVKIENLKNFKSLGLGNAKEDLFEISNFGKGDELVLYFGQRLSAKEVVEANGKSLGFSNKAGVFYHQVGNDLYLVVDQSRDESLTERDLVFKFSNLSADEIKSFEIQTTDGVSSIDISW